MFNYYMTKVSPTTNNSRPNWCHTKAQRHRQRSWQSIQVLLFQLVYSKYFSWHTFWYFSQSISIFPRWAIEYEIFFIWTLIVFIEHINKKIFWFGTKTVGCSLDLSSNIEKCWVSFFWKWFRTWGLQLFLGTLEILCTLIVCDQVSPYWGYWKEKISLTSNFNMFNIYSNISMCWVNSLNSL